MTVFNCWTCVIKFLHCGTFRTNDYLTWQYIFTIFLTIAPHYNVAMPSSGLATSGSLSQHLSTAEGYNMVEFFLPCWALWWFGQTASGKLESKIFWGVKRKTLAVRQGTMELAHTHEHTGSKMTLPLLLKRWRPLCHSLNWIWLHYNWEGMIPLAGRGEYGCLFYHKLPLIELIFFE